MFYVFVESLSRVQRGPGYKKQTTNLNCNNILDYLDGDFSFFPTVFMTVLYPILLSGAK